MAQVVGSTPGNAWEGERGARKNTASGSRDHAPSMQDGGEEEKNEFRLQKILS